MGGETKDRQAIATPSQLRDVMIVPDTRVPLPTSKSSFDLLQQNWIFSQQWKQADPGGRGVVELRVGGGEKDFLDAIKQAAQAARGHEIILAVGHGGAGHFRGLTQTVFDAIPNAEHGLENHPFAIKRDILDLPDVAEKKDGKWVPKAIRDSNGVITRVSQGTVDARATLFEMMTRAGELMRAAGVSRFVIVACNVAKDQPPAGKKAFHELLAAILGVDVVVYGGLVAIAEVTFTNPGQPARTKEQIWIAMDEKDPDNGRPPAADPDHASFHELPQTARVVARVPSPEP
jgi:hypothetical protein